MRTHIRGTVGLIEKGTRTVVGLCELVDCKGPLSLTEMRRNVDKHRIEMKYLNSKGNRYYAWIVANVRQLKQPLKYNHKSGKVMWHSLPDAVAKRAPLTIRGRYFSPTDLVTVSHCVKDNFDKGRTYISEALCKQLSWKQPNGWLKDRACRDALVQFERMGLIELPPPLIKRKETKTKSSKTTYSSEFDLVTPITTFPPQISLEFAKGDDNEKLWNELVERYHYLGHQVQVGRCIKYLVKTEDRLLGAVAFSSPAWNLSVRDELLTLIGIDPARVLDLVINNSRFLILPNVTIPNLASRVLSIATSRVLRDWTKYYSIAPQVAETFVQPSKFLGTCYKAANWIEAGFTKGYAKKGSSYHNSQEPKRLFLYGLNPEIRRELLRAIRSKQQAGIKK